MFNNYTHTHTNMNINSCSGGIYKTYPESFMIRFHLKSELAKSLLVPNPLYNISTNEYYPEWEEVVILQMVICGDMEVIAEIITKKDFDKIINNISEKNELEGDKNE